MQLTTWFNNNKLIINTDKSVTVPFHITQFNDPEFPIIKINNKCIKNVNETKFLGLWIQNNMKWYYHIDKLNSKLSKNCYAIRILKRTSNLQTVLNAYFAQIHSLLKYGIIFWGYSAAMPSTFKIQKRAVRIIKGCNKLDHCRPLFKNLAILPLPCIYILELIMFVKKNLHDHIFQHNFNIHEHNTRNRQNLHIDFSNTSMYKQGPFHVGKILYNRLPMYIKLIDKKNSFKSSLKAYLMDHCFYSVNEYLKKC